MPVVAARDSGNCVMRVSCSCLQVDLVGFAGHSLTPEVSAHPNICEDYLIHPVDPPGFLKKGPFLLATAVRVLLQVLQVRPELSARRTGEQA